MGEGGKKSIKLKEERKDLSTILSHVYASYQTADFSEKRLRRRRGTR